MVYYGTHIAYSQIIRPGCRQINSVDHIFPFFIVKMTIFHNINPPAAVHNVLMPLEPAVPWARHTSFISI